MALFLAKFWRGAGAAAEGPGPPAEGPAWGRPNREGHRRPPPPWGAGGWGRPNREGHHRRRRGARGGGRPQRVPDKFIKYKEKAKMRKTTGNPDQTGNLPIKFEFRTSIFLKCVGHAIAGPNPTQYTKWAPNN